MLRLVPSLSFPRLPFTDAHFHIVKEKAAPLLRSELVVRDKSSQRQTEGLYVTKTGRQTHLNKSPGYKSGTQNKES